MKKFLAMLALLCSVTANAQGPDFPISFVKVAPTPEGFMTHKGNQITWHSTIPGLSFCVAYSAAHGMSIAPRIQGHLYSDDITHCMTTDGDGNASDVLTVDKASHGGKGVVLATVILAGDQYNTIALPAQKLQISFYY